MITNLIFDADGTLFDSYDSIIDGLQRAFKPLGIEYSDEFLRDFMLKYNSHALVDYANKEYGIPCDTMHKAIKDAGNDLDLIHLMPGVKEMLAEMNSCSVNCFIYTHRNNSVNKLCDRLGITEYFREIVNSTFGFARKPSSEAVDYLVNKYEMDKNSTYYVGDRTIDMDCAKASNIGGIFYESSGIMLSPDFFTYKIKDFKEMRSLIKE